MSIGVLPSMNSEFTSFELYKIIEAYPGIDSIGLNLMLIKKFHPKEFSQSKITGMIQTLIENRDIRHLIVTGRDFSKSYYFPSSVRFSFS
jgi:hypothetical protein